MDQVDELHRLALKGSCLFHKTSYKSSKCMCMYRTAPPSAK